MGGAMSTCFPQTTAAAAAGAPAAPKGYENERRVALEAVEMACKLCLKVQEDLITSVSKDDRSPVTVADFGAQAIIIHYLSKAFPEDLIIAEENAKILKEKADIRAKVMQHVNEFLPEATEESVLQLIDRGNTKKAETKRWWALDPVDGTQGFLRREQYAVCLALMVDNQPVLGVLGCPNLPQDLNFPETKKGCILIGVRAFGAYQRSLDEPEETPIHVASIDDSSLAVCTESVESAHASHDTNAQIAANLGVKLPPVRLDSQCKYAVVARGDSTIYLRLSDLKYREKVWDHAAGVIILREAGGEVNDFHGKPLDFSKGRTLAENQGIVCTNGKLHDKVMKAIKEVDPFTQLALAAEKKASAASSSSPSASKTTH